MMKLEENFDNEHSIEILNKFVEKLVSTQQQVGISGEEGIRHKYWQAR